MIAEVYINRGVKKLNRTFDYKIPDNLEGFVFVGSKVIVPFGKGGGKVEAFVVSLKESSIYGDEIKEIIELQENLSDVQIELSKWMAKRYFANVSDCIKLMLAPGVRNRNINKRIENKTINVVKVIVDKDIIEQDILLGKIKSEKHIELLRFSANYSDDITIPEIEEKLNISRSIVKTLIKNGYLELVEKKVNRNPLENKEIETNRKLQFTFEQKMAYDQILDSMNEGYFREYLIHGVTGSGKTEIYLQLINQAILNDKTAIMLVPEISLTPQIIDRFVARFGKEKIAVIHSKLSIGERHDEWQRIENGEASIVIGARSAVFAPTQNLGIIIIDEEHDSSYKSETNPRYDAIEVARYIAEKKEIPLLLGSATPSINSYYNSEVGEVLLLELTKRANDSKLPELEIIDLKQELAEGNRSMLSRELYASIEQNLKDKNQTLLFLNRRGHSTFIMCRECGYTVKCKNCNISMTYHLSSKKLKCHYCGYEEKIPTICPECKSDKIRYFGTGTEKLEEEIKKQFVGSKTIRMDVDTVSKKNSHEEILNKFLNEDIDIMVGTQMIVKGHHFPNVTLVGVIAADSSLNIDDYRANERTFQILTQVAGRAGRENKEGKVIVQTYTPENFSIQCVKKQSYKEFYEIELELRKQLKYPPFCDIIVIGLACDKLEELTKTSNKVYEYLKQNVNEEEFKIFKPMPSPIDKIQNKHRWRIIIKGNMSDEFNELLHRYYDEIYLKEKTEVQMSILINPNNMM